MTIMGVDFRELAKPADLEVSEDGFCTVLRMSFEGRCYTHALHHFELFCMSSNEAIIAHLTNIINVGKHCLGIKDTPNECT